MAIEKARRMSFRVPLWVANASFLACGLLWLFWGIYLYWDDVKLVNFLAAWIPFVLSTLIAFVPEHRMSTTKKILWRSSVMSIGFAWSVVLWHQQVVADRTMKKDQEGMVTSAVTQSNKHADEQLGNVKSELGRKLDTLEKDLNASIGKVKPPPPQFARLQFSFKVSQGETFPSLSRSLRADADGLFTLEFYVRNVSDDVAAEKIDMWIVICDECRYATEPPWFEKLSGSSEQVRHRYLEILNHGIGLDPWKASISVPSKYSTFDVGFKYACQTCGHGEQPPQMLKVFVIPPFTLSAPTLKPKPKPKTKPSPG